MTIHGAIPVGSKWLYVGDSDRAERNRYRVIGATKIHVAKDTWRDGVVFVDDGKVDPRVSYTRFRDEFLEAFRPA